MHFIRSKLSDKAPCACACAEEAVKPSLCLILGSSADGAVPVQEMQLSWVCAGRLVSCQRTCSEMLHILADLPCGHRCSACAVRTYRQAPAPICTAAHLPQSQLHM